MGEEGYAIVPAGHTLAVVAASDTGIFYGAQTVKQMISGTGEKATLTTAVIRDWPAMRYRGLHDDLSRGPIPTLDFQKRQIRTLAAYKVNVYSPYFEHTLAYASHPLPAWPGGSMTPADVRELVTFAAKYHVMIIPEQETFGHLHHTLTYEKYADLAETPLGNVLAPGQDGVLDLITQWYDEIAREFPGPFLHIGADETFDLGRGRTEGEVRAKGLGAVYIDFLKQIHTRLTPLHRRLLFWGDVAMNDPQLVKTLPKDMIAVAWEYNPVPGGFNRWLKPYTDAGMETWVGSGVNNWNRVYPDNNYALANIQGFVRDGQRAGSTGLINTVWNDDGEGLFLDDWYGVLFGAAAGWQPGASNVADYQRSFGPVFHGDTSGKIDEAQQEMMAANKVLTEAQIKVSTDVLFWMDPWSPQGQVLSAEMRPLNHELRLHAEQAIILARQARQQSELRETDALDALELGARRLDFIGQKFETADEIVKFYSEAIAAQSDKVKAREISRVLWNIAGVNGLCEDMRDGYTFTGTRYSELWLRENRPYWLGNVLAHYDLTTQLWIGRADRFLAARAQWAATKTLPSPSDLGLPSTQQ